MSKSKGKDKDGSRRAKRLKALKGRRTRGSGPQGGMVVNPEAKKFQYVSSYAQHLGNYVPYLLQGFVSSTGRMPSPAEAREMAHTADMLVTEVGGVFDALVKLKMDEYDAREAEEAKEAQLCLPPEGDLILPPGAKQ